MAVISVGMNVYDSTFACILGWQESCRRQLTKVELVRNVHSPEANFSLHSGCSFIGSILGLGCSFVDNIFRCHR